jgi:hypothetical protein
MRASGQNEILPKNLKADVQPRDWMYGLKFAKELHFNQPSNNSYFLILELF